MATLHEIVHRGKILRKSLGKRMKRLRKSVGKGGPEGQELRAELEGFRRQLGEVLDLEATRASGDGSIRVDIHVEGQPLLNQISVGEVLAIRDEVKYQQKLYRQLARATEDPVLRERARRIEALRSALEMALSEANHRPVEERSVGEAVDAYLFDF